MGDKSPIEEYLTNSYDFSKEPELFDKILRILRIEAEQNFANRVLIHDPPGLIDKILSREWFKHSFSNSEMQRFANIPKR